MAYKTETESIDVLSSINLSSVGHVLRGQKPMGGGGVGVFVYSISLHMDSRKSCLVRQQMPSVKSHRAPSLPLSPQTEGR